MDKYYDKPSKDANCTHGVSEKGNGHRGHFEFGHAKLKSGATDSYAKCRDCGYEYGVVHRRFK